jgi:3-dehydroquinate synthase
VITEGDAVRSEILVGRGMLDAMVEAVTASHGTAAAVLCQPSTYGIADRLAGALAAGGFRASGYTLPDGEEAKQMSVVESVYRHLNDQRFTRDDVVVAVGGGSLTDVAGFVAGTYLRGVPAMYLPTTLLGAVDAAVGGKTGVNVDGKNLAGVFRHPRLIVIDVDILDALPERSKREGAAEAVKTGFIADMEITRRYESDLHDVDLEEIVNRAVAVKASVVSEDFTESGRRAVLNYGHTVGHAVESSTGCSHGEAVAIGMVAAGAASHHVLGFEGADRQVSLLRALGLPTDARSAHRGAVRSLMALDKKRDANGLRFVLLAAFERPEVVTVDDATVDVALDAVGLTSDTTGHEEVPT